MGVATLTAWMRVGLTDVDGARQQARRRVADIPPLFQLSAVAGDAGCKQKACINKEARNKSHKRAGQNTSTWVTSCVQCLVGDTSRKHSGNDSQLRTPTSCTETV